MFKDIRLLSLYILKVFKLVLQSRWLHHIYKIRLHSLNVYPFKFSMANEYNRSQQEFSDDNNLAIFPQLHVYNKHLTHLDYKQKMIDSSISFILSIHSLLQFNALTRNFRNTCISTVGQFKSIQHFPSNVTKVFQHKLNSIVISFRKSKLQ